MKNLIYLLLLTMLFFNSCDSQEEKIIIYSGRKTSLSKWIFEAFEKETGIKLEIKNAPTRDLVNVILSEGDNSLADIFYAQDASSLAFLSKKGFLSLLNTSYLNKVDKRYYSKNNDWVGVSGRLRVLVYNSEKIDKADLPISIVNLTDSRWFGEVGWAPENSSFQSHIAFMVEKMGKNKVLAWLKEMKNNNTKVYPKNTPIVKAVIKGEISMGLVNHYYLYRIKAQSKESSSTFNYIFPNNDVGTFMNISGAAILKSSRNKKLAQKFIKFILSKDIQKKFQSKNYEYPVLNSLNEGFILEKLNLVSPNFVDFTTISDLNKIYKLLKESGVLTL